MVARLLSALGKWILTLAHRRNGKPKGKTQLDLMSEVMDQRDRGEFKAATGLKKGEDTTTLFDMSTFETDVTARFHKNRTERSQRFEREVDVFQNDKETRSPIKRKKR